MTYYPRALKDIPLIAMSIKDPKTRIGFLINQKQHYQSMGSDQEVQTLIDGLIEQTERYLNLNFTDLNVSVFLDYCKNNSIEKSQIYTFVNKFDKEGLEYFFDDLRRCGNGLLFEVLSGRYSDTEIKEYVKYSVKGFFESCISDILFQNLKIPIVDYQYKVDIIKAVISSNNINDKFEMLNKLLENERCNFIDDFGNISEVYNIAMKKYLTFEEPKQTKTKAKPNQLPTKLKNDIQRGKLYDLLKQNEFIPDTTNKEGFIWAFGGQNDNYTSFSIEWLITKNLAVYLIDKLCNNYTDNWAIGERIFSNVKGMRQMKDIYQNNKNGQKNTENLKDGKPKGYELIDAIISEAQK